MRYLAECRPDTLLVKLLTGRRAIHRGGKTRLIKKMIQSSETSKGLIDEDPQSPQPPLLRRFKLLSDEQPVRLKIYGDKNGNRIVMLSPNLEEWIIGSAREVGLKLKSYGLPDKAGDLRRVINLNLRKFQDLILDLKDKSPRMKALSRILRDS